MTTSRANPEDSRQQGHAADGSEGFEEVHRRLGFGRIVRVTRLACNSRQFELDCPAGFAYNRALR
jgi:hypothetical protein